ncbi:Orn/Lys/Arg decarboxylase N-terminal domain-containing protein [Shigella flexneri]
MCSYDTEGFPGGTHEYYCHYGAARRLLQRRADQGAGGGLIAQGFQIIWPQNSADLLKFIEHNPRISGVIFDWDEYSVDFCGEINQLNEYLPLYAFINAHSRWMLARMICVWRYGFSNTH